MREKIITFLSNSLEILGLNTHYEIDSSSPFFLSLQEKPHPDSNFSKQNQLKQLLETFQTSGYLNYGLRESNFAILTLAENKRFIKRGNQIMSSREAQIAELERQIAIIELERKIAEETQRVQRERQQIAQMQAHPPQTTHQPFYTPYYPPYTTAMPPQQVHQTPLYSQLSYVSPGMSFTPPQPAALQTSTLSEAEKTAEIARIQAEITRLEAQQKQPTRVSPQATLAPQPTYEAYFSPMSPAVAVPNPYMAFAQPAFPTSNQNIAPAPSNPNAFIPPYSNMHVASPSGSSIGFTPIQTLPTISRAPIANPSTPSQVTPVAPAPLLPVHQSNESFQKLKIQFERALEKSAVPTIFNCQFRKYKVTDRIDLTLQIGNESYVMCEHRDIHTIEQQLLALGWKKTKDNLDALDTRKEFTVRIGMTAWYPPKVPALSENERALLNNILLGLLQRYNVSQCYRIETTETLPQGLFIRESSGSKPSHREKEQFSQFLKQCEQLGINIQLDQEIKNLRQFLERVRSDARDILIKFCYAEFPEMRDHLHDRIPASEILYMRGVPESARSFLDYLKSKKINRDGHYLYEIQNFEKLFSLKEKMDFKELLENILKKEGLLDVFEVCFSHSDFELQIREYIDDEHHKPTKQQQQQLNVLMQALENSHCFEYHSEVKQYKKRGVPVSVNAKKLERCNIDRLRSHTRDPNSIPLPEELEKSDSLIKNYWADLDPSLQQYVVACLHDAKTHPMNMDNTICLDPGYKLKLKSSQESSREANTLYFEANGKELKYTIFINEVPTTGSVVLPHVSPPSPLTQAFLDEHKLRILKYTAEAGHTVDPYPNCGIMRTGCSIPVRIHGANQTVFDLETVLSTFENTKKRCEDGQYKGSHPITNQPFSLAEICALPEVLRARKHPSTDALLAQPKSTLAQSAIAPPQQRKPEQAPLTPVHPQQRPVPAQHALYPAASPVRVGDNPNLFWGGRFDLLRFTQQDERLAAQNHGHGKR